MTTRRLRVLHVNFSDQDGGAARAAHRLHRAQCAVGMDSRMLVVDRRDADPSVLRPWGAGKLLAHRLRLGLSHRVAARQVTPTNPVLHSLNWFSQGLAEWINRSDVDLVNLHWIGQEMMSVEEVGRLRKPVVWTMHDMWPFSGAEHYDDLQAPGRYREVYGPTNRPPGYEGPDLDAWVWRRKRRAWRHQDFLLASPSRWLADCARNSALLGHQRCEVVPNCVDTDVFKPIDRHQARFLLNLNPDKRYVLFGAMSSTSDTRKGFHVLRPALKALAGSADHARNTELLVFGAHAPVQPPDFGLPTHYLGTFHDDLSLALLYNAADVLAAPSMQDNLPNTLVEAHACGTPCVAFSIGGMPDLIAHGETGQIVAPFSVEEFSLGLSKCLNPDEGLRERCRNRALLNWCGRIVAERYQDLYHEWTAAHPVQADRGKRAV